MKPTLDGTKETVNFDSLSTLRLYENTEYEEYPYHWHTVLEIIMPLENNYAVDCGIKSYTLQERDILLIAPGTLHHCYAKTGKRIILQIDMKSFSSFASIDSLISFLQPELLITKENCPEIHAQATELILKIADAYQDTMQIRELQANSDLLQLFYLIGKNYMDQMSRQSECHPNKRLEYMDRFMQVCDYIKEHCVDNLSLEEMADYAGFSKYHFSRLFKDFTGTTFYKYLNACRIAKSELLLMDRSATITEVATNCGFNSVSAFLRMFRIIKGCTPTAFRSMQQFFPD